ncbi:hypothetical protein PIB30_026158 [Stylosanthes scabra]|uniref:Uncharacterized protein n=1 Tax=Stylosanthes scabra TaxID=79078 RepID=A0ABU6VAJ6_9FABA|nr:hypothetical protein [Stylosanthes scabra]
MQIRNKYGIGSPCLRPLLGENTSNLEPFQRIDKEKALMQFKINRMDRGGKPKQFKGNPNRLYREQGRGSSKDKLSQELATSSKIPSMGLGLFSQRVNSRDDLGCEKNRGCNCV